MDHIATHANRMLEGNTMTDVIDAAADCARWRRPSPALVLPAGPAREALCEAVRALDEAEGRMQPAALSQAMAQVGRCYRGIGALSQAEWYLLQALRWGHALGSVDFMVELFCDLAEVAVQRSTEMTDEPGACHAAQERARDHCFEAMRLANRVADPHWEVNLLIRIADVLDRCGDRDDALALQQRALQLMVKDELPWLSPEVWAQTCVDPVAM